MKPLRDYTPARVALNRAGDSIAVSELLEMRLAQARARDAIHCSMDVNQLRFELASTGLPCLTVRSAAQTRAEYLRRPDLGRRLHSESRAVLEAHRAGLDHGFDVVFVIADGLSALAVHHHVPAVLNELLPPLREAGWRIGPLVLAEQARVAVGDEIGSILHARMVVVLIGERPGSSSPDSLGAYLTWEPRPGRTDAERNCISNIRHEGLSYSFAAHKLLYLMTAARTRHLSGVPLKEDAGALAEPESRPQLAHSD